MKSLHACPLFLFLLCLCAAGTALQAGEAPDRKTLKKNDEVLLQRLDRMIAQREVYQRQVEQRIARLRRRLENADTPMERFNTLGDLFNCYRSFRIDTALIVARERVALATEMECDSCLMLGRMNLADVSNKMGQYEKALSQLNSLERTEWVRRNSYFYYLCHTTCLSCYNSESNPERRQAFRKLIKAYRDTLMFVHPPGSAGYITNKCARMGMSGEYDEAIRELETFHSGLAEDDTDKASVEYQLAELYMEKQDTALARHYLILSSITDIANAKKVYMSLQRLAILLAHEGDVSRAYHYIFCSLEDINFGKAHYRIRDITTHLPIIKAAYEERIRSEERLLWLSLLLLLALVLTLTCAFFFIRQRNRRLVRIKQSLADRNEQMQKMAANLTRTNEKLKESNHIKEEYIALLFNICSEHIYKQENERKALLKVANTGSMADVSKMLRNHASSSEDFKQFIGRFDTIFLSLFPNFVDDFNSLLREEERIQPRSGELLTPELRIYALIRLGIDDSSKIANFLHYSLQTVYNYRMKMRNKSLLPGKDLALQVQKLG